MNLKKKFETALQMVSKVNTTGEKDKTSIIVRHVVSSGIIRTCDDTFYLIENNLLVPITDRETHTVIRCLLTDSCKAEVSTSVIKEAVERLRDMTEIQIDIEKIRERNKYRILLLNGVFDTESGKFTSQPDSSELFLYCLNFSYISDSTLEKAPVFNKFAQTSIGTENLDCLLEWLGYTCTALVSARKALFLIGTEKCGKSVLLDVMENALGSENTSAVPFSKLGTEQSRIKYQGKISNLSRETSAESLKNDDAFKSLVSGDKITGRYLYENSKEFVPFAKFTTASNFFPQFKNMDTATLDRIIPVYFKDRIESEVPTDYNLKDKLITEKDIIFSMALDRTSGLIKSGYQFSLPERSDEVLKAKRAELLNVREFITENLELTADGVISSVALYQLYTEWCSINATAPDGRNTFYSKVTDYSSKIKRGKFLIGSRLLNGFKGLKEKCNYKEKLYGQPYQDSHSSIQKGGEVR